MPSEASFTVCLGFTPHCVSPVWGKLYFVRFASSRLLKGKFLYLCSGNKEDYKMTTTQLNAEVLRNMSIIAEDENLLRRAAKYLRKLVAEKEADSAELTEEEFFARVERAREQSGKQFDSIEHLDQYIRSL